jgi:hypothetical protein
MILLIESIYQRNGDNNSGSFKLLGIAIDPNASGVWLLAALLLAGSVAWLSYLQRRQAK